MYGRLGSSAGSRLQVNPKASGGVQQSSRAAINHGMVGGLRLDPLSIALIRDW